MAIAKPISWLTIKYIFIQGHQVAGGELKAFSDMLEFTTLGQICNYLNKNARINRSSTNNNIGTFPNLSENPCRQLRCLFIYT